MNEQKDETMHESCVSLNQASPAADPVAAAASSDTCMAAPREPTNTMVYVMLREMGAGISEYETAAAAWRAAYKAGDAPPHCVYDMGQALHAMRSLEFPVLVTPSFTFKRAGQGVAVNDGEFYKLCEYGFAISPTREIVITPSLRHGPHCESRGAEIDFTCRLCLLRHDNAVRLQMSAHAEAMDSAGRWIDPADFGYGWHAARSAGAGTPGPAGTPQGETCPICEGRGTIEGPFNREACLLCIGSGRSPTTRPKRQNNE